MEVSTSTLMYWLKKVWNTFVPDDYRFRRTDNYSVSELQDMDQHELRSHVAALIEELLKRPERSCLIDVELNWMNVTFQRLSRLQIEDDIDHKLT